MSDLYCRRCEMDWDELYIEGHSCIVKEIVVDGQKRLDGKKYDEGKPELGLVPKSLIWATGTILTFGAKKYGAHNWRKGLAWSRVYNAILRHLTAFWDGENLDTESGKSHLWHAATELAFLIEFEEKGVGHDDRYLPEPVQKQLAEVGSSPEGFAKHHGNPHIGLDS